MTSPIRLGLIAAIGDWLVEVGQVLRQMPAAYQS
jgi:hypothetical protein